MCSYCFHNCKLRACEAHSWKWTAAGTGGQTVCCHACRSVHAMGLVLNEQDTPPREVVSWSSVLCLCGAAVMSHQRPHCRQGMLPWRSYQLDSCPSCTSISLFNWMMHGCSSLAGLVNLNRALEFGGDWIHRHFCLSMCRHGQNLPLGVSCTVHCNSDKDCRWCRHRMTFDVLALWSTKVSHIYVVHHRSWDVLCDSGNHCRVGNGLLHVAV